MKRKVLLTVLLALICSCAGGNDSDISPLDICHDCVRDGDEHTQADVSDDDDSPKEGLDTPGVEDSQDIVRDADSTEGDDSEATADLETDGPCVPDCAERECGNDGCGGYCGSAESGECADPEAVCLADGTCCVPYCWGAECGPDSCGGFCGLTGDGSCVEPTAICVEGDCCIPECAGNTCGNDGCGGNCGACDVGECIDGACCDRGCDGRECGPDACGGFCGELGGSCEFWGEVCLLDGTCCLPNCWGRQCGEDGCGGYCGDDANGNCLQVGAICTDGTCCLPSCDGQECGFDGCGGSCGNCANGICAEGQCVDQCEGDPCGLECCLSSTCYSGSCCAPDCNGKICGTDGCGGTCGTCGNADCWRGKVCTSDGMVEIPPAVFYMGCNSSAPFIPGVNVVCPSSTKPQHVVSMNPYEIDVLEVRLDDYVSFLNDAMIVGPDPICSYRETTSLCFWTAGVVSSIAWDLQGWKVAPGKEAIPAWAITWTGAGAYCEAKGKRLCTEAEWERAARGGCELYNGQECASSMPLFPWGNDVPTCDLAQYECGEAYVATYSPVGVHPDGASPYGVEDLSGNAPEWVEDCWHPDFVGAPADGSAWACVASVSSSARVVKGGSAFSYAEDMRAMTRGLEALEGQAGFRCCRSPE